MRVFMLGWEFPPFISGGLGTACYGLTKALDQLGLEVIFVLPQAVNTGYAEHVKLLSPDQYNTSDITDSTFQISGLENVRFHSIKSTLQPYLTPQNYQKQLAEIIQEKRKTSACDADAADIEVENLRNISTQVMHYAGDMYTEIHRYAAMAANFATNEQFDVIHAHDWMTYPAGMAVAAVTGKPLIVQVHSTEFDRSGENVNQMIYEIERKGMHAADKIIAVSQFTRNIIVSRYGVSQDKVEVVHNGVERNKDYDTMSDIPINKSDKVVLFLGRLTMQKGPEYFLAAARKVLETMDNVKFVMAGSGDMMHRAVEMAAHLGIGRKVLFTGFLQGGDVRKIYQMADLYVMPSVSEPFGIAPLEALNHDVPVIISKQSGVAEVLTHALKVDFWDIDEMANKIIAVLKYPPLQMTLREQGNFEVRKLRWKDSAQKCAHIYEQALVSA